MALPRSIPMAALFLRASVKPEVEVIGCAGRIISRNATDELLPYIIQSIFLLIPPSLFAASIYMVLGRIIRGLGPLAEAYSIIRVKWLTTLFVVGDVFAFLVQGGGAGLMASVDTRDMGNKIVIAGLTGGFSMLNSSITQLQSTPPFDWQALIMMLYATSVLILFRCIFRIIEYIMGPNAYLLVNEWPLYVFDLTLMVITMGIFLVWYPSMIKSFSDNSEPRDIEMVTENTKVRR
ncbi:RTA1 [Verticillium alfalfae VaMs.102]|uniref:RTA1 n=1 Tax=Verticillium alfalfae (strain VaMs.102 / ATCC MYA-4576 / FGSC 10136) TaxID=526221 RepID=C9SM01_VERA1|nr:RTA1 [Verticillium alfalfae VaMs.102]EEY19816.1 RTA1 [Verticillium alfalfae VaMs.102]